MSKKQGEQQPTAIFLSSPGLFVAYYIDKQKLKMQANGSFNDLNFDQVVRDMWLLYIDLVDKRRFSKSDLIDALDKYCDSFRAAALAEYREQFRCETENLEPLRAWLTACTGAADPVDVSVWAHTLCNLKRKMFGLQSSWEMMPCLIGKQGSGKSRALLALLKPLEAVTLHYNVEQVTDDRIQINFARNFACMLDELSKGKGADIETIKRLVSQPVFNARRMRQNETGSYKQNCTFFGASNYSVAETFRDETGARRFWDTKSLDKTDHATINSLDYVALIKGIDERRDEVSRYTAAYQVEIEMRQAELTAEDPIQTFVEAAGWLPGTEQTGEFISMSDIIKKHYNPFAEDMNLKKFDAAYLGKRLSRLGFGAVRDGKSNDRGRYIIRTKSIAHLANPKMKVWK